MKVKVMTFNLRCPAEADGINYFPNREKNILKVIQDEAPDLIGFQEAADYSRQFLKENISDRYVVLGCGRHADYTGEACCIAFNRDRFDLIDYKTRFLSGTPCVPGTRYAGSDQSGCPRLYSHALLSVGEGKVLNFYNTHLDHKGEIARLLGMTQIVQDISECDAPFVLTGDMNAYPDERTVTVPFSMKHKDVREATAEITHTFHNFGKKKTECKIDYIYTDAPFSDVYAVEDKAEDGVYISDHYPICATLEI